jgi:hypothetical protein
MRLPLIPSSRRHGVRRNLELWNSETRCEPSLGTQLGFSSETGFLGRRRGPRKSPILHGKKSFTALPFRAEVSSQDDGPTPRAAPAAPWAILLDPFGVEDRPESSASRHRTGARLAKPRHGRVNTPASGHFRTDSVAFDPPHIPSCLGVAGQDTVRVAKTIWRARFMARPCPR